MICPNIVGSCKSPGSGFKMSVKLEFIRNKVLTGVLDKIRRRSILED